MKEVVQVYAYMSLSKNYIYFLNVAIVGLSQISHDKTYSQTYGQS